MDNEAIEDLFARLGNIEVKRLFGGKGIYHRGVIIAIVLHDELMLKADEALGEELSAAGCSRWTYKGRRHGRDVAMPYWTVPDGAADDPDEMGRWAQKSYEAALRLERKKA